MNAATDVVEVGAAALQPVPASDDIGHSRRDSIAPVTCVDLPVCDACLRELFDPENRRYGYPYIACGACGPRYSLLTSLPFNRAHTTMAPWPPCAACRQEFDDPDGRRFQMPTIGCPNCGPHYRLEGAHEPALVDGDAIVRAAALLRQGAIVAIKDLGGYRLVCDARQTAAVHALRSRTFRNEQPFAVMVATLASAEDMVALTPAGATALIGGGRPIVMAAAREVLQGVAPDNRDLGVLLPHTPLHHWLFSSGAPSAMAMTGGHRCGESLAHEDDDARTRLAGLADVLLIGERAIACRVDDSVWRCTEAGTRVVRRARGIAPAAVAPLASDRPILAVGADRENAMTLVTGGHAVMSMRVGDLRHPHAQSTFVHVVHDLLARYAIDASELTIAHDLEPDSASTIRACCLPAVRRLRIQHHRAHVASVLAEREALDTRVIGVALDGGGHGDDGSIWGGEFFAGSVASGLTRIGHLRPACLVGGDASSRRPWQTAAGFLEGLDDGVDLTAPPFRFPRRYRDARERARAAIRAVPTTSAGRLLDTVAALLGFTRAQTFDGQAAAWLEHLALASDVDDAYHVIEHHGELDYRPALADVIQARSRGFDIRAISRAFHRGLARGIARAAFVFAAEHSASTIVLSGDVFENALLPTLVASLLEPQGLTVWTHTRVPANDGGVSLGQAALAAACPLAASLQPSSPAPFTLHHGSPGGSDATS